MNEKHISQDRTKAEKLALIWRHTHRDSRSKIGNDKAILCFRTGLGTCLVPLDCLTDDEIGAKLYHALRAKDAAELRALRSEVQS